MKQPKKTSDPKKEDEPKKASDPKKEDEPKNKNTTKRCPNGSRKNKAGECIKYDNKTKKKGKVSSEKKGKVSSEKKGKTSSEKKGNVSSEKKGNVSSEKKGRVSSENPDINKYTTPRTSYANRYFADKNSIHLLNIPDSAMNIFQVNYKDVSQFTSYQNLSHVSQRPLIDCVFQSIFSLGLRNVSVAKRDSMSVNNFGKSGVEMGELKKYIKSAFNLVNGEKIYFWYMNLKKKLDH
jgi:hypothetical protein